METEWISKKPFFVGLVLVLAGAVLLLPMKSNMYSGYPLDHLPGALGFFAVAAGSYWLGRKFFGKETILLSLFVMSGSLLLINAGKWGLAESWVWAPLVFAVLGMIGYLKQPRREWKWLVWGSWILALSIQPLEAFIGILVTAGIWRFRHPKGKVLDDLYLWAIGPLAGALSLWGNGWELPGTNFHWSWASGHIWEGYGLQLSGMLPWLGFLAAGVAGLLQKRSKEEELSILLRGLLAGAFLSNTLLLQWACAILVAKQLQRIFHPAYPLGNLVKALTFLTLTGWLLGGILILMLGYYELGGTGFRIGMSLIMAYWIPGLLGAIGLLGKNHMMMCLGMALSAILFSLAFWTQGGLWLLRT